jgi:hypothetical protein
LGFEEKYRYLISVSKGEKYKTNVIDLLDLKTSKTILKIATDFDAIETFNPEWTDRDGKQLYFSLSPSGHKLLALPPLFLLIT